MLTLIDMVMEWYESKELDDFLERYESELANLNNRQYKWLIQLFYNDIPQEKLIPSLKYLLKKAKE